LLGRAYAHATARAVRPAATTSKYDALPFHSQYELAAGTVGLTQSDRTSIGGK
jgi:hypothetical protein